METTYSTGTVIQMIRWNGIGVREAAKALNITGERKWVSDWGYWETFYTESEAASIRKWLRNKYNR